MKGVPDGTKFVELVWQKSLSQHHIWHECGRPRNGAIVDVIPKTHAIYHRTIRHVKQDEKSITRQRFARAMLGSNGRDTWSEVKTITRNRGDLHAEVIDSCCVPQDVALILVQKYSDLFNTVPYLVEDMQTIEDELRGG